jgi:hypothetical protein
MMMVVVGLAYKQKEASVCLSSLHSHTTINLNQGGLRTLTASLVTSMPISSLLEDFPRGEESHQALAVFTPRPLIIIRILMAVPAKKKKNTPALLLMGIYPS